ncbi:MAG: AAA family ATPase [Pseudomonadota bacterium]
MHGSDVEQLERLLHAHFPVLVLESDEEERCLSLIAHAAGQCGLDAQRWSIASGFQSLKTTQFAARPLALEGLDAPQTEHPDKDPEDALATITSRFKNTVIVLLDFHPYFESPRVVRQLKELALAANRHGNKMVLLSHAVPVPPEIQKLSAPFTVSLPTAQHIEELIDREAKLHKIREKTHDVAIDPKAKSLLVRNLTGITYTDAERLVRNAIQTDDAITQSDLSEVMRAKYDLISNDGALSFEYDTRTFDDIGGFTYLKSWLNTRRTPIVDGDETTDRPKGMMLLGVQGCGKSLCARAVAGQLGVPLIRFDIGAVYNKFIGESERNIREMLRSADVLAPCVLWIDEIEKAISGGQDTTGASQRVLGTLLSWMQDNNRGVFIVATANDVTRLPPEIMRKGRLDEVFFVDLPTHTARKAIVAAVLGRRGQSVEQFDLDSIAAHSDGFSGAEIEQAIVSANYGITSGNSLMTVDIVTELGRTQPLSVLRRNAVSELRAWAQERTVDADTGPTRPDIAA